MRQTEKRLNDMKVVLNIMKDGPLRFTKLREKATEKTGSSVSSCDGTISLLLSLGHLARPSRGLYKITPRGVNMLAGLDYKKENNKA